MPHIIEDPSLPAPILNALRESIFEYSTDRKKFMSQFEGQYDFEFSVTDLTRPTKQYWLSKRYGDEITIDLVKDNYWSLLGSIAHFILEHYAPAHYLVEERQHCILNVDGHRVLFHGKPDAYDPEIKMLYDYKFTSPYSFLNLKWEYEFQLNANKYLFDTRGIKTDRIANVYMFRELNAQHQRTIPNYPTKFIEVKEFEPWERSVTENKIKELILEKINASQLKRKELPDCSDEERWMRDSRWVAYKRKKATKKEPYPDFSSKAFLWADTEQELNQQLEVVNEEVKKEYRPGEAKRCDSYCAVAPWCHQRQQELKLIEEQKKNRIEVTTDD